MTTDIDKIKEALKSPRIRDAKYSDLTNYLAKAIGLVFAIRSAEIEARSIQYMAMELARTVLERFPGISTAELGIALDKGVKRDYGDYFGLNVVTFLDWVRAYFYSPERNIAISEKINSLCRLKQFQPKRNLRSSAARIRSQCSSYTNITGF